MGLQDKTKSNIFEGGLNKVAFYLLYHTKTGNYKCSKREILPPKSKKTKISEVVVLQNVQIWYYKKLYLHWFLSFYCCSLQLSHLFPHCPYPAPTTPSVSPPPLSVPMSPLFMFLCLPFPFFAPLSRSPIPSGHCQFVLYFQVSVSILFICLFCWLGSTCRWDHVVFVFHRLAYFT